MSLDYVGEHTLHSIGPGLRRGDLQTVEALVELHRQIQRVTERAGPPVEFDENAETILARFEDQL